MRQAVMIALLLTLAVLETPLGDWPRPPKGWLQYVDSSGVWRAAGGEDLARHIQNYEQNPAAGFWPGYGIMAHEPGDWYVFQVGMRTGYQLILSAESTVTLYDKKGTLIASGHMRLLRYPGQFEAVADLRASPLMVRTGKFRGGSVGPSVAVRFPWGSVIWAHVASFTVSHVRILPVEGGD